MEQAAQYSSSYSDKIFRKFNLLMKNYGVHFKITEYIISFKYVTDITNSYDLDILRGLRGSDLSHQSTFLTTSVFSLEDLRKIQSLFMFSCFMSQSTEKLKIVTHIQPPQTKVSCYSNQTDKQSK